MSFMTVYVHLKAFGRICLGSLNNKTFHIINFLFCDHSPINIESNLAYRADFASFVRQTKVGKWQIKSCGIL